jgi:uncharacterized membrane protein
VSAGALLDASAALGAAAAGLGAAATAGLLFIFSNAVLPALAARPAAEAAGAMRAINRTILNPGFLMLFFGTAAAAVVASASSLAGGAPGAWLAGAGAALYLGGAVAVTGLKNVPLNDALRDADLGGPAEAALWARYLIEWRRWNDRRVLCCAASAGCFLAAGML